MTDSSGFFLGSCSCSRSCMTDSSGFFLGSCSCSFPFPRFCCASLVDFSLLCKGSCCVPYRLHVLLSHHCSSRPSPGFHKAEFHQVPCMHQSRLSCPPSQ